MEKETVWIYCSVASRNSIELLNYQEHVLNDLAFKFGMKVVGVSKIISEENKNCHYQIEAMRNAIRTQKVGIVLVYTKERISADKDVADEFMMFCDMCHVELVTYQQLKNKLVLYRLFNNQF
ncbi:MAG: hypothetical protein LUG60_15260 [Erysipelotrichaceae bacterium]|nr:hypothetical protein [Erysipelotrichaceae bacterium]